MDARRGSTIVALVLLSVGCDNGPCNVHGRICPVNHWFNPNGTSACNHCVCAQTGPPEQCTGVPCAEGPSDAGLTVYPDAGHPAPGERWDCDWAHATAASAPPNFPCPWRYLPRVVDGNWGFCVPLEWCEP